MPLPETVEPTQPPERKEDRPEAPFDQEEEQGTVLTTEATQTEAPEVLAAEIGRDIPTIGGGSAMSPAPEPNSEQSVTVRADVQDLAASDRDDDGEEFPDGTGVPEARRRIGTMSADVRVGEAVPASRPVFWAGAWCASLALVVAVGAAGWYERDRLQHAWPPLARLFTYSAHSAQTA